MALFKKDEPIKRVCTWQIIAITQREYSGTNLPNWWKVEHSPLIQKQCYLSYICTTEFYNIDPGFVAWGTRSKADVIEIA